MNVSEINQMLKDLPLEQLKIQIEDYKNDTRSGVVKLVSKYKNKLDAYEKQIEEWQMKCEFDKVFHKEKYVFVGVDEVGRGPLAGPVVAAAVILPYDAFLPGLKDSKKMTESKREELFNAIQEAALAIGVGSVKADRIDEINILNATFEAMRSALQMLNYPYDLIGVDGNMIIPHVKTQQHAIIAGDDKSASIAAASVIAKVTRDRMMKTYAKTYPEYDWEKNKGYGSHKHYESIREYGITPLHRKSFLKNEGIF